MKKLTALILSITLLVCFSTFSAHASDLLRDEDKENMLLQMGLNIDDILSLKDEDLVEGAKYIAEIRDTMEYLFQIIVTRLSSSNKDLAKELIPDHSSVKWISAVDLYELDIAELSKLKDQINIAMWYNKDWQEVLVPEGFWKIGEDIPAGHWTIRPASPSGYITIEYGNKLQSDKKSLSYTGDYWSETIIGNESYMYDIGDAVECDIKVVRNYYIEVSGGGVIFTPYTGKPDLGFK